MSENVLTGVVGTAFSLSRATLEQQVFSEIVTFSRICGL